MELASVLKAALLPLSLASPSARPGTTEHPNSFVSEAEIARFAGTIRGRVVEAGSGAPIVGATDTSVVATDTGDYTLVVTSAEACALPATCCWCGRGSCTACGSRNQVPTSSPSTDWHFPSMPRWRWC